MNTQSSGRIVKLGLNNFWRNGWLSFAATFIMTLTLLIISVFMIFNLVINTTTDSIKKKIDLTVYFQDNASDAQIRDLKLMLQGRSDVKEVVYLTKEDAFTRWQSTQKNEKIRSLVTKENNFLPRSLEVKATNPESLENIANFISGGNKDVITKSDDSDPGKVLGIQSDGTNTNQSVASQNSTQGYLSIIRKISYQENKNIIEKLINITKFSREIGIILSIVFLTISILVIFNTIRLTIFTRETEIEIMRLVGANDSFIRTPFLIEGSLYGIFATILSLVLIWAGLYFISPMIARYLGDVSLNLKGFFLSNLVWIAILEFILAVVITTSCSWISIRKNLKV